MAKLAFYFDSSRCSACKGCQAACKTWNSLPSPLGQDENPFTGSYQSPLDLNGDTRLLISFSEVAGGSKGVEWSFGRRSCFHCTNAGCVQVCPSGALAHDEETGMVRVTEDKCIGCQYCKYSCPFNVPRHYGYNDKINKCTSCLDRVSHDRQPACVKTCQSETLMFGSRDELLAKANERVAKLQEQGFERAAVYGGNELGGLGLIVVAHHGIESLSLPANPRISGMVNLLDILKPLAGLGAAAVLAGLGVSFLTGIGYERHKLRYDEETHDIIDDETNEVLAHFDFDEEE